MFRVSLLLRCPSERYASVCSLLRTIKALQRHGCSEAHDPEYEPAYAINSTYNKGNSGLKIPHCKTHRSDQYRNTSVEKLFFLAYTTYFELASHCLSSLTNDPLQGRL